MTTRRVLLGALLFVFGGGSIGYWLAERIADPVSRLTRATARLARIPAGGRTRRKHSPGGAR